MARPQPATQQRLRICGTEFGDDDRYRIHSVNAEPADSCMKFSNNLLQPPPVVPTTDLASLNRIRVETALSRFPIHRLAKQGNVSIDLLRINDAGEADFKWEVSYNSKHGQPGPLAYKVDTLVVNRRIDEARRPVPEILKL